MSMIKSSAKLGQRRPQTSETLSLVINSTIIDRSAGVSTTEAVWDDRPNQTLLGNRFKIQGVSEAVSDFFQSRRLGDVIAKLVPTVFLKPGETAFTKENLFTALRGVEADESVAACVMELVNPALTGIGLVSSYVKYSRRVDYGWDPVTVDRLKENILVWQVSDITSKVKLRSNPKDKVARTVFAEDVAEAFRVVGQAIDEIADMDRVIDDLVLGVRLNIDPNFKTSLDAAAPTDWRHNRVVEELSTNYVFVKAALNLSVDARHKICTPLHKLEDMAQVALTAIRSSDRFAIVSKAEALATYSLAKVRDVQGKVHCVVVSRDVRAVPVAQAVCSVDDVTFEGARNISATRDRIADAIQHAYGSASFGLVEMGEMLETSLRDLVEAGYLGAEGVVLVDVADKDFFVNDIAALCSSRLHVEVADGKVVLEMSESDEDAEGETSVQRDPVLWYAVETDEKTLPVWSGSHLGDIVITRDPVEALKATRARDAVKVVDAKQQLLAPSAFNTRLIDFDDNCLLSVKERFSFSANIAGIEMRGSFSAQDFASLRAGSHVSVVRPQFNTEVVRACQQAFRTYEDILNAARKAGKDDWKEGKIDTQVANYIRDRLCRELLRVAQTLAPSFRHEVEQVMVERSVHSQALKGSDAELYRSRTGQRSFQAYADLVSLLFFLHVQGINGDVWTKLATDANTVRVCVDMGSDRGR